MGKRDKQRTKVAALGTAGQASSGTQPTSNSELAIRQSRLPKKRPVLLTASVILFALWFAFLLVTALRG
jgi:hypothetical protein